MNGWRAECLVCPTAPGMYGETVHVGAEYDGDDACGRAESWRSAHRRENPGHLVRVSRYERIEFDVIGWNEGAVRRLFGG